MNQNTERWMHLCEQASTEQDTKKLMSLVSEINAILDEQQTLNGHANHHGKSLQCIDSETQERLASADETIKQSQQLIDETRRIVNEHRPCLAVST